MTEFAKIMANKKEYNRYNLIKPDNKGGRNNGMVSVEEVQNDFYGQE